MKVKFFLKSALIAIALMILVTGCSVEDLIEDLTSQEVTYSQTIFDGQLQMEKATTMIAEEIQIAIGNNKRLGVVNLADLEASLIAADHDLNPLYFTLSSGLVNQSSAKARVTFYLADAAGGDLFEIGYVPIESGQSVDVLKNSNMQPSPADVAGNILEFFVDNPSADAVELYAATTGSNGEIRVKWAAIETTPVFRTILNADADDIDNYAGHVDSIDKVALTGSIENFGESRIRFVLVISDEDGVPDFENGLVADGFIEPGEKFDVTELMVEGGQDKVKLMMHHALAGTMLDGNVFILGADTIQADINKLKIKTWLTVSL